METPSDTDILPRLELARAIARQAGELTLRYFRSSSLTVDRKADDSPVTVADREAETLMRRRIAAVFPDDGILGEEYGEVPGGGGFRWIIDPIDGTKSFVAGVPLYGNLVAVEHDGTPIIGVINIPAQRDMVYAAAGHGAFRILGDAAPAPARVSDTAALGDGVFLTSEPEVYRARGADEAFSRLIARARMTRTWGDAFGYVLVATGRATVMVDPRMELWDAAPMRPILEEAGGTFTSWTGEPTHTSGEGVATNGATLEEVLAITRGFVEEKSDAVSAATG